MFYINCNTYIQILFLYLYVKFEFARFEDISCTSEFVLLHCKHKLYCVANICSDNNVIGPLAPYLYSYWHHASRLPLVIETKRKKLINIAQTTPDRKKNKIMAHLTHSISRNNASVLSKIADKTLPIFSNFIQHVLLRIILVSFANAASLKHDCKLLSCNSFTTSFLMSTNLSMVQ